MEEWFSKHIGKFMSAFIAVILFAGTLIGYIYDQDKKAAAADRKALYESLDKEIKSRKAGDKALEEADAKIELKIQNKLDIAVFNTHLTTINYMKDDMGEMKKDIKIILRNTD